MNRDKEGEVATELESPETILKNKLNYEVKEDLIRNRNPDLEFLRCLEIPDKTAIVINIIYKGNNYYIYFSTKQFLTDIMAFRTSPPAIVYTKLKPKTPVDERESNLIMFLFLLKMREKSVSKMSEPLFEGKRTILESFQQNYPTDTYSRDDIRVEVARVIVDNKLKTYEEYDKSCIVMGGKTKKKTKKKSKRKSKKIIVKERKSKKRIIKGRGKSWK
jgi:hypothetical protein